MDVLAFQRKWIDAALDHAARDACGWPVDEVDEDGILSRLLALNEERAAAS